jgi:hypothetical protein
MKITTSDGIDKAFFFSLSLFTSGKSQGVHNESVGCFARAI